ncbi:type II toxin-antitoxin system prevent-host-death family antitoxin [Emergencia sp.]|uniref:type II toxin-antitoxin system prevent-host-death family antitoxin n=1 Tax=Emergencia sp. TaxID=1926557 RepID=UPI003AF0E03E
MMIDTSRLVAMTEANQNFSKVAHMVEEEGIAVIMKNNKPKFVVVDFDQYEDIQMMRQNRMDTINSTADRILTENLEAFKELAK